MSFNAFKHLEDLRNSGLPHKQAEAQFCIPHEVIESSHQKRYKRIRTKANYQVRFFTFCCSYYHGVFIQA